MKFILLAVFAAAFPSLAAAQFDPPDAVDINPDPNIVEINLVADEGTWQFTSGVDTDVYMYNGSVPGPTIRAEVGDTLIVNFTNNLAEDTTIHWHGVETPADMDGSHISQLTVPPGGTFRYEFPLLRDGLQWYHPHVRTFDQVEKSLYGCLLVRDSAKEQALGLDTIPERIVVFDDILLDDNSQIVPAFSFSDPLENAVYHANGREGNVTLVNGRSTEFFGPFTMANGQPQRWRVLNAANTTFCRLDIHDATVGMPDAKLWQIGSDGGFLEAPIERDPATLPPQLPHGLLLTTNEGIFLTPGERMDVIFLPINPTPQFRRVLWKDWVRGRHAAAYSPMGPGGIILPDDPLDGRNPDVPFMDFQIVGNDPGPPYYQPPASLNTITVPDPATADGTFPVRFGHAFPDAQGNITFFAQMDSGMNPLGAALVDPIDAFDAQVGETWIWEMRNLSHGDHPFHAHGFPFIPYEIEAFDAMDPSNNEILPLTPMLKDTVRVPPRRGLKGSSWTAVRAVTVFDDTGRVGQVQAQGEDPTFEPDGSWTSGGWLFHCHVLEHSGKGMLSFFELHEPDDPFWLLGKANEGTNGKASLTGSGTLIPDENVVFEVVNAFPGSQVALLAGFTLLNFPIVGGVLIPSVESYAIENADPSGRATFDLPYASPGLPSGTIMYLQAIYFDPGTPNGIGFTNGMQVTFP